MLDLQKTRDLIERRIHDGRAVTYGDIARESGVEWRQAFRRISAHLWNLNDECEKRGDPWLGVYLGVYVENASGMISPRAIDSIGEHALKAGKIDRNDPEAARTFVQQQRRLLRSRS